MSRLERLPFFLPETISASSAVKRFRLNNPRDTGTLISPLWEACCHSSTTTLEETTSAGSSSSFPLASAPLALICAPGLTHSFFTSGFFEGVHVTRISAPSTHALRSEQGLMLFTAPPASLQKISASFLVTPHTATSSNRCLDASALN